MKKTFYEKLGEKISHLRKKAQLTRAVVAKKAGISTYYVGEIERGQKKASLDILIKIAKIFHMKIYELLKFR